MTDVDRHFLLDHGAQKARLTPAGRDALGDDFLRMGIRPDQVVTFDQINLVLDGRFDRRLRELANQCRGDDAELDRIMEGFPGWD